MARNGLTPTEAGRTTLREFDLYTLSYQIKLQEWRFKASFQSWQNQTVQATEGKGKNVRPKFKEFKDFYDFNKDFNDVLNPKEEKPKDKPLSLADKNRLLNGRR